MSRGLIVEGLTCYFIRIWSNENTYDFLRSLDTGIRRYDGIFLKELAKSTDLEVNGIVVNIIMSLMWGKRVV